MAAVTGRPAEPHRGGDPGGRGRDRSQRGGAGHRGGAVAVAGPAGGPVQPHGPGRRRGTVVGSAGASRCRTSRTTSTRRSPGSAGLEGALVTGEDCWTATLTSPRRRSPYCAGATSSACSTPRRTSAALTSTSRPMSGTPTTWTSSSPGLPGNPKRTTGARLPMPRPRRRSTGAGSRLGRVNALARDVPVWRLDQVAGRWTRVYRQAAGHGPARSC